MSPIRLKIPAEAFPLRLTTSMRMQRACDSPGENALVKFLGCSGTIQQTSNVAADEELSKRFVQYLADLPMANLDSSRPLDQALILLKTVRDKAVAHHERVDSSLLRVPGWSRLGELIDVAREVTEVLADSYGEGGYYIKDDANRAARSLVRLLELAGLSAPGEPRSV